jgi:hypothetical protein
LFFGIIDLLVLVGQDDRFFAHYLLETGWGLLYTALVMVPLLLWAVDPRADVLLQQVLVVAISVLVTGLAALALGQVLAAAFLAASALGPGALARRSLRPRSGLSLRGANPWLASLALVAVAAALLYAVAMIRAAHDGTPDDETWGLMHLPMQAGFGLALAGSALVGVSAAASGQARWRWPLMLAAVSAVWFGVVSMLYPEHLGSLGAIGGAACVGWGFAVGAASLLVPTTVTG